MLSPNARNRVRDSVGDFVGPVGGEPPHAPSRVHTASKGKVLRMR
jgi:hypothetical protein